jgi:hypothetical protein
MNKNSVIALIIILAVYFGPFAMLFAYDNNVVVHSAKEIFLFLAWIIGMIAAFYISVNKPFGKTSTVGSGANTVTGTVSKAA